MKSSAIVCLLLLGACASSGGSGVGAVGGGDQNANVKRVTIGNSELKADARSESPTAWHDIAAPLSVTWQRIPVAYQRLGLSITRYDTTAHIIEGERLRSKADFGGKQLTSLLDCGDVAGMPNVTRFDVNIQVRTVVAGSATKSSIASSVIGSSKPGDVAGIVMPCVVNSEAADRVALAVEKAVADTGK